MGANRNFVCTTFFARANRGFGCPRKAYGLMPSRVYITGASGCGVTTLGKALATRLGAVHIDTDDHYWIGSEPPYREERALPERLGSIRAEQGRCGRWVISGSLEGWGERAIRDADLIVFLEVPTAVRLQRLRQREGLRFGEALLPGGTMHETHRQFIARAAAYEDSSHPGRNRMRHEQWLARAATKVLRLDGTRPLGQLVTAILRCS
jgi:adenylate kinase family enzyme